MTGADRPALDPALYDRLAAVAEAILPATVQMPGAGAVGVAAGLVDRALRAEPRLAEPLAHALSQLPAGDVETGLRALRDRDASAFGTLVLVVVAAYFMAPEARAAIGYDGQHALLIDTTELPHYLEDGTLDRVVARGPFYRDIAAQGGNS